MCEDGEARFREPKTVHEERELVEKAIPLSTKIRTNGGNIFWRMGLFKGYDLHKVAQFSTSIEEMDAGTLNYWLSKFVMEVAKKSGERYPLNTVYGIICGIQHQG